VSVDAVSGTRTPEQSRSVVRAFGHLAVANIGGQALGFVALAYVANRIGPANLGAYNFAAALTGYLVLLANLGLSVLAMREIAVDPGRAGAIISQTLVLRVILSCLMYAGVVALGPSLTPDPRVDRLLPIVGLTIVIAGATLDWALLVLRRARLVAVWRFLGQVVYAALVFLFMVGGFAGAKRYAWFNVVGLIVTATGLLPALWRARTFQRTEGANALVGTLRRSMPYAYTQTMIQVYATIDMVILGYLRNVHTVGEYAAASKLPMALVGFAGLWFSVFFPHAADRLVNDRGGFAKDLRTLVTSSVVIALGISATAPLCASQLIGAVFGTAFGGAATPFALLSVYAAIVLIQVNFSNVLLAAGSQRYYMMIITLAATATVGLNLALVPALGATGAALSTLLAEVMLCCMTVFGVRRRLDGPLIDRRRVLRGLVAAGVAAGATAAVGSVAGAAAMVATALLVFLTAAVLTDAFDASALLSHVRPAWRPRQRS
jgi:O-antigen/teichoic acid export membrane protein